MYVMTISPLYSLSQESAGSRSRMFRVKRSCWVKWNTSVCPLSGIRSRACEVHRDCKSPTTWAWPPEDVRRRLSWPSRRRQRCWASNNCWRSCCSSSPSMLARRRSTSTRSTSRLVRWQSILWSLSTNLALSPEGRTPVSAQAVAGHLGIPVERGWVLDGVRGVNSSNRWLWGRGGSCTTGDKPPTTGSRSGPGVVTGGKAGDPWKDGDSDNSTDNVGVASDVNAGDATTVGAGEDTGDSLMTIGESGVGSGTVAAGFWTAANSGVSFTTTLWSPVVPLWARGPQRLGWGAELTHTATGEW